MGREKDLDWATAKETVTDSEKARGTVTGLDSARATDLETVTGLERARETALAVLPPPQSNQSTTAKTRSPLLEAVRPRQEHRPTAPA